LGDDRFRILKNADMPSAPDGYIIDEVSAEEAIAALDDLLARNPRLPVRATSSGNKAYSSR
jgi:hypothetical protein